MYLVVQFFLWTKGEERAKEGLVDQREQIHNLVPSVLNEGIKAGIVELVDSKVGDKQLYPGFGRGLSIPMKPSLSSSFSLSLSTYIIYKLIKKKDKGLWV